jgi:hypothetical protein
MVSSVASARRRTAWHNGVPSYGWQATKHQNMEIRTMFDTYILQSVGHPDHLYRVIVLI